MRQKETKKENQYVLHFFSALMGMKKMLCATIKAMEPTSTNDKFGLLAGMKNAKATMKMEYKYSVSTVCL